MRKMIFLALAAATMAQPVLAASDTSNSTSCDIIAKACLDAGYNRADNSDKRFWQDCMKPILLNKTAADVTVEAKAVKSCRHEKIAQMKVEMKELQKASS